MTRSLVRVTLLLLASAPFARAVAAQEANPVNLFVADIRYVGGRLTLGLPRQITRGTGRSSQPSFTPDGRAVVFAAQREGGQVDVYRVDLATGQETQITHTPENENSPAVMPDGRIMVIRWKPETLFREWGPYLYRPDGTPDTAVLDAPDTVGYFGWADAHTFAFMRPGSRFRVALWDDRTRRMVDVDSPAAPLPPQKVPGARAMSYTRTDSMGRNVIRRMELDTRRTRDVAPALVGRTAHAWTPRGELLMARGASVYVLDPARGRAWRRVASYYNEALQNVTAYAVNPQGTQLVLYSSAKLPLHTVLRDSLQAGRSGAQAAAVVRRMAADHRELYELSEGALAAVADDWEGMERHADALEIRRLVAELFPSSHAAHALLGDAYRRAGQPQAGAEEYRRSLALNPRATEAEKTAAAAVERALAQVSTPP